MTIQPGATLYTQSFGSRPEGVEVPVLSNRAPAGTDNQYPLGKRWINVPANTDYSLTSFTSSPNTITANWTLLGSGAGDLNTLTTDDLTVVTPSSGNINIAGAGVLSTSGAGDTVTINFSGELDVASGGTGANTLTNHGVLIGHGTSAVSGTTAGTTGQALVSGGASADPAFAVLGVVGGGTGVATLTGVLTGNGTSAVSANAVTEHGVLLGGASNAVSSLAVASTGTVLAGSTGADPAFTGSPSVSGSVTAGTTLTATLGDITATNGNLALGTAGNKLVIATGANASVGTSSAMSGSPGAVTVATTACSATAKIFYSRATTGGTTGDVSITAQDGTGFTLTSTGDETSTFNWWIINA